MIIIIILVHLAILGLLKFTSFPEFYIFPYLTSLGFKPYLQIIDQHFPGLMFFPLNFYTLGFRDPVSFQLLLYIMIILQAFLVYRLSRLLFNSTIATISVLFYSLWQLLFAGNSLWYETFLPLFTLPALYLWFRKHYFLCGLFLGLGILFKQTILLIPVFILIHSLFIYSWKVTFKVFLGCLIPVIFMITYFIHLGVIREFIYWTIYFNLFIYPTSSGLLPSLRQLLIIFVPLLLSGLGILFLKTKSLLFPILIFTIFSSLGGLSRFDLTHFQASVPYLAILTGVFFVNVKLPHLFKFFMIISLISLIGLYISRLYGPGQYPYFDNNTDRLTKSIIALTGQRETLFLLGPQPHLYALTGTLPSTHKLVFTLPWYYSLLQSGLLTSLIASPPRYVYYDPTSQIDNQNLSDFGQSLVKFINLYYHPLGQIDQVIIYEKNH